MQIGVKNVSIMRLINIAHIKIMVLFLSNKDEIKLHYIISNGQIEVAICLFAIDNVFDKQKD